MTGSPDDRADGDLTGRLDADRPDPLEPLLRPPTTYLVTPPGAFHRIRRRAARRRRARAVMVAAAAAAVFGGAPYLIGAISTNGGDELAVPTATGTRTGPDPHSHSPRPATPPSRTSPPTVPTPTHRPPGDPSALRQPARPAAQSGRPVAHRVPHRCAPLRSSPSRSAAATRVRAISTGTSCSRTARPVRARSPATRGSPCWTRAERRSARRMTRDRRTYAPVVLEPGGSASVTIHTINRQGECLPTSAQLRIYPPGDTASLVIPGEITNCDDRFSVTPFAAGDVGEPVGLTKRHPIGHPGFHSQSGATDHHGHLRTTSRPGFCFPVTRVSVNGQEILRTSPTRGSIARPPTLVPDVTEGDRTDPVRQPRRPCGVRNPVVRGPAVGRGEQGLASGRLAPHGDVLRGVLGERRPVPVRDPQFQLQPRDPCHEVEFRLPRVPVPGAAAAVAAVVAVAGEVVRDEDLLDQVEGVEAEMPLGDVERYRDLSGRQKP